MNTEGKIAHHAIQLYINIEDIDHFKNKGLFAINKWYMPDVS